MLGLNKSYYIYEISFPQKPLTFNNFYVILVKEGKMTKQQFYLPTYEDCVTMTKANECFYEKQVEVNGVKVSVF